MISKRYKYYGLYWSTLTTSIVIKAAHTNELITKYNS